MFYVVVKGTPSCKQQFKGTAMGSYGWTLPFIIISLLAATGPKAFLMALALPLGQSALSLAFDKIWGKTERKRKRKFRSRMRRKPFVNNANDVETDEEEDEGQETRKQRTDYQSWVAGGPVDKSSQDGAANFGGWDDLERLKSAQRPSRMKSGSGRRTTEKGKLSRRERKSDTPLLLRLLIAVFPFLGSWTKMLW
ncbi:hypothetical protein FEM48_Zijuj07G0083700 [Ziziphus jujuba var. spinosa]|uniref:Uncharacterized protein n=1 Tax=Ziziphus jujuba var. spinosa TaxID=714518 RepID=A0A978V3J3_ZIZJJ|nr:hypothetical protein FEM48_Zijuj07G0083700 [Ziziphus jujuba var. spinosa]